MPNLRVYSLNRFFLAINILAQTFVRHRNEFSLGQFTEENIHYGCCYNARKKMMESRRNFVGMYDIQKPRPRKAKAKIFCQQNAAPYIGKSFLFDSRVPLS